MRPQDHIRALQFGKRLKALMDERGLSQSDLAAEVWERYTNSEGKFVARGRDRISVWINGLNYPDKKNMEKLAKALKVEVSELEPDGEMRAVSEATHDAIISFSDAKAGQAWVQIAQFMPIDIALEIMALVGKARGP